MSLSVRSRSSSGGVGAMVLALALAACFGRPYRPAPPGDLRENAAKATAAGDWETAADLWHRVQLAVGPADPVPILETARALFELGDLSGAAAMISLGLRNHPDDADLHELQGDVLVAQRFRRAAEGAYRDALEIEPERRETLIRLARLQVELGLDQSALATLERLIALGSGDYDIYRLLALARAAGDDPVAAYDAWTKAFTLADGDVLDQVRAASLCLDPELVRQRPNAPNVCRKWLELALERDPQCTLAHFQIGVLAERAGDLESAEECYLRAAESDPACLPALTNLALLYARDGNAPRVREMVQRALLLERDPDRKRALERLLAPFAEPALPQPDTEKAPESGTAEPSGPTRER